MDQQASPCALGSGPGSDVPPLITSFTS